MAFDKNNNGVISNKNLIHALRRVGLNPTEVREDFLDAIASLGLGVTLRMLKTKRLETYQTS